ncbi:MAG: RDD family protein [bacterium]
MKPEYPSITRRYLATLIDGLFMIFVMIMAAYFFQQDTESAKVIRVGIVLAMFLVYEPFCTSKIHTLGQGFMGIRVRKHSNYQRISIPRRRTHVFS